MTSFDVYNDIATRTNGDIYVGVVGPVRTGKSTFITKMMELLVLPNIKDNNSKSRTIDELPQSGDGKSIMTTQPKFIPNEAVNITLENDVKFNIRLIDCVGYLVDGAIGHIENAKPRLVNTPWSENQMPFEEAAEFGTKKVIVDHSTIGVIVTTDGSITELSRENYVKAEERVVKELQNTGKPFVMVLNSTHPKSPETINLQKSLKEKYKTGVVALDVSKMGRDDVAIIFEEVLNQFPITNICVKMPDWLHALNYDNNIIQNIINEIFDIIRDLIKVSDIGDNISLFENNEYFEPITTKTINLADGKLVIEVVPKNELFYKVLSEQCGAEITSNYHLISYVKQLSIAKTQFDKLKDALDEVKVNGYGVVRPSLEELSLEEPKMYKQSGKFGVKLKASAPSLHIMQVDIETEVNSMVGNEQQSEELVKSIMSDFENNPSAIWETKMFGKSLNSMVNDGLNNKLTSMPQEIQRKMRKTLGRIVNEGKGGVICILL